MESNETRRRVRPKAAAELVQASKQAAAKRVLKEQAAPGRAAPAAGQVAAETRSAEQTTEPAQAAVIPRAQTRSLQRGLAALEFVAQAGEAGVAEVAAAMGLPRASAHILLSTLTRSGYLRQMQRRGRYRVDLAVLPLAQAVLRRLPVRERAGSLLHELASSTGLAVYLAVLWRGLIMTVDRVVPTPRPDIRSDVGTVNPAYASSMGKVLLAYLPPEELESYLATVEFVARTEQTITSVEALRQELAAIRQRGYALSDNELLPGVRSLAAPVFAYDGEAVAAVCVRHYTPPGEPPDSAAIAKVEEIAQRISFSLGYGAQER